MSSLPLVSVSIAMSLAITILAVALGALFLDALIGDPRRLHPVVGLGRLALLLERGTRAVLPPLLAGALTSVVLPLLSGAGIYLALSALSTWCAQWAGPLLSSVLSAGLSALVVSFCIATRSLAEHTGRVLADLERGDLLAARHSTSMIVGRDTAELEERELVRATVECLAESISDGITAPLAFAVAGGILSAALLPAAPVAAAMAAGGVVYRAINTMDSMFGYRNERYLHFGRVPARLDDVANLLPARLSALCVVVAAALLRLRPLAALRIWWRDGLAHSSPNAGQCEAAFAGALGVALGGPATYQGRLIDKPQLGEALRPLEPGDIRAARRLMVAGVLVCAASLCALAAGAALALHGPAGV